MPVSGKGIGVLINDSGVDGTHDDIKFGTHLVQNALGSTDLNSLNSMLPVTYIEGVPNTSNNSGHGTQCAGTVGGNGTKSGGKYEGVAPGASLLGYVQPRADGKQSVYVPGIVRYQRHRRKGDSNWFAGADRQSDQPDPDRPIGHAVPVALSSDRSVAVASPKAGVWTLKIDGLRGVAMPETVTGTITLLTASGTSGRRDIVGHPAEASIKMAVSNRLVDGIYGEFRPNESQKRIHLADYLTMGQAIHQFFPTNGSKTFFDVEGTQVLLAEAVTAKGGALRDNQRKFNGVMRPKYKDIFSPWGDVNRVSLTYSLVQGVGLQEAALARTGKPISVTVNGETLTIEDASSIPAGMEGYVSVVLDLTLTNAFFTAPQGPYDLKPTLHATFKPAQTVSQADFAVIVTRTFPQWEALTQPAAQELVRVATASPNPFSGSTTISYTRPKEEHVTVEVSSVLGDSLKTLVNEQKPAGRHEVSFDGNGLMPGNYPISVKTPTGISSRRVVVK